MSRKKKLLGFLIFCVFLAVASLLAVISDREGGVLFVGSAVTWGISVVGAGFCLIELDKLSGYLNSHL